MVTLVNPLSDEEPALRTTLLPGLLGALRRNDGRGSHDLALFETGLVFRPTGERAGVAARLPVDRRPDRRASSPRWTPRCPASRATSPSCSPAPASRPAGGARAARPTGPTPSRRPRTVAREAGVELTVRAGQHAPWHPGRCAALYVAVDGDGDARRPRR